MWPCYLYYVQGLAIVLCYDSLKELHGGGVEPTFIKHFKYVCILCMYTMHACMCVFLCLYTMSVCLNRPIDQYGWPGTESSSPPPPWGDCPEPYWYLKRKKQHQFTYHRIVRCGQRRLLDTPAPSNLFLGMSCR